MKQQRGELEKLMEERQRLLSVQFQLQKLNRQMPSLSATSTSLGNTPRGSKNSNPSSRKIEDSPRVSLPEGSEVESSNRELWSEMRRHKILREELRQKRKELEELLEESRRQRNSADTSDRGTYSIQSDGNDGMGMSADVTTQATWGGSTTHMSDMDDEDEEDVDDGYPSDGIVQVEEEEEQEGSSDHDTYTIEADYRHRSRRPLTPPDLTFIRNKKRKHEEDDPTNRRPYRPNNLFSSRRAFNTSRMSGSARQENVRSAEELIREDERRRNPTETERQLLLWQCQQLQQQLNTSTNLCHTLLRDQQSIIHLLGNNNPTFSSIGGPYTLPTPTGTSPSPFTPTSPYGGDSLSNYNFQLQQQQLLLNINHAYNQLYQQQLEIRALQEHFQQLTTRDNHNHNNSALDDLRYGEYDSDRPSLFASHFQSPHRLTTFNPPYATMNSTFNLSPQFPSTFSHPTNYASAHNERLYDSGNRRAAEAAGYPKYERQDASTRYDYLRQFEDANQNPWQNDSIRTFPRRHEAEDDENEEECYEDDDIVNQLNQPRIPPLNLAEILKRAEKRRATRSQQATDKSTQEPDIIGTKFPSQSKATATRSLAKKDRRQKPKISNPHDFRPGLSAGISGTAFVDTASLSSAISSVPGGINEDRMAKMARKAVSDGESDAQSDFSLFEALRENIYSEVATLISQNESRPHYLIELFRELQMLNTDYLRQRALYSMQDLVSRYLTEENLTRPIKSVVSSVVFKYYANHLCVCS
uniref:Pericentriolar material 1 protein-like n=1 Tax=Saccoglossus kowalevskii TaxID=10224 RepID=A0ABM0MK01_SACKO|nr:PREDICTED: pericentriolar material 1 protein-like [Saccoglossus kowalevskii]